MDASKTWQPDHDTLDSQVLQVVDEKVLPAALKPYEPFDISFTVENIGNSDIDKLWLITSVCEQHFPKSPLLKTTATINALKANDAVSVTLRMKLRQDSYVNDFRFYPLAIGVTFYLDAARQQRFHQHNMLLNSGIRRCIVSLLTTTSSNLIALLTTRLQNFRISTERSGHILIFGEAGTGKTTLIKTMLSALKGSLVFTGYNVGSTGATSKHQTTELRRVALTPGLHILDAWGCAPDNYINDTAFRYMVSGSLPLGWHMESVIRLSDAKIRQQLIKQEELRPDAVFFTFTHQLVENDSYRQRIKRFIAVMSEERPGSYLLQILLLCYFLTFDF